MEVSEITDEKRIQSYICSLYAELFGESAIPTQAEFEHIFNVLSEHFHTAYEVTAGSDVVAFFTLSESFSIFAKGRYGIINELWVSPDYRSRGIGSNVVDEIVSLAKLNGWSRIDVSAPPNAEWDKTFEFYQKCGFEFTGRKLKRYI